MRRADRLGTLPAAQLGSSITLRSTPKTQGRSKAAGPAVATPQITEIFAGTKPYPEWWTDLDDVRVLRRRKSLGDNVLDRNICFVDTPGFDAGISVLEGMDGVLRYIEAQMAKNLDIASLEDAEILSLLGGSGGSQVDVVLYVTDRGMFANDLPRLMLICLPSLQIRGHRVCSSAFSAH